MTYTSFTFSDVNNRSGEVLGRAMREPVVLTRYGKPVVQMAPVDTHVMIERIEYVR